MAGEQSDLDRSEAASPYKIEKAHRRGSIFKSAEVTFAAVLLAITACVHGLGEAFLKGLAHLLSQGLVMSGRSGLGPQGVANIAERLGMAAAQLVAVILFAVWVAATLVAAVQARGVFSAQPLTPDFSRINPAQGFKKLFSMKSLVDLARNSIKLAVLGVAATVWGRHHLADFITFQRLSVRPQAQAALDLLGSALGLLCALYLVFAALDWAFNRWDFGRQMRMSKREVKDEHKEREGDPRIKSRLRELRLEWMRRARSMAKVKGADVLVTNPTHYAVALQYRHGEAPAPRITARGAGELALRMRQEARRHGVPIVENPPLARALFKVGGAEPYVPETHFQDVARILRWVYAGRRARVQEHAA